MSEISEAAGHTDLLATFYIREAHCALDAAGEVRGAVFVPPGVYLCSDLKMHANTAANCHHHRRGEACARMTQYRARN